MAALELENLQLKQDLARVTRSMYDPLGEFEMLNEQIGTVCDSISIGNGVECHGVKFSHPSEIAPVLRACKGGIAIFHNAVSLLHSIGASTATHKSTLATMKAQRDVKMTSDLEARVITSF